VIEEIDKELKLGRIGENEGEEEKSNLIQELAEEKERMEELNLPERASKEEMEVGDKEKYDRKSMSQEDVSNYKEVEITEERRDVQKRSKKEILIKMKPSAFPLDPEADEDNSGNNTT
jgi:hypothetical protein